jgi:hypothetical protein
VLKARDAVRTLKEYHPPLGNREGLRLDFNENTSGCSPQVLKRLRSLDGDTLARYPEREKGEAVVAAHLGVASEELLLTNGTDEAIHLICESYLNTGDEVLLVVPTFAMFEIYAAATGAQVVFGDQNWSTRVEGYNEQLPTLRNWKVVQGNFFDESHVKTAARVAVLGQTVVNQLFGGRDPVGQTIRIRNLPFQVLGVLDKKGFNSWGRDQDDTIMVPYTTVQKKFQGGVLYVQSGIIGAISARATRQSGKVRWTARLETRPPGPLGAPQRHPGPGNACDP